MTDGTGFLIDDDVVAARTAELMSKIKGLCQIDRRGQVHLSKEARSFSAKERIKLVLAARFVGARLDDCISCDVSLVDLSMQIGLPRDQVSARTAELNREGYSQAPGRGVFRAVGARIEQFLDDVVGASA